MKTKPNKPASPARRRLLKAAAGAVAAVAAPAYGYEVEAERLQVVRRTVRVAGWPRSAAGLRVGQLSDLHCQDARAVDRTARAARLLLAQTPDVVFLTGDFVSGHRPADWTRACADALTPLTAAPHGAHATLGNHDWACPNRVVRDLTRGGISTLRNRAAPLPGVPGVWLVGLDSCSVHAHDPIRAMQDVPEGAAKILLVHEPDYADEAPHGFALQLSGHSHGGQIRLPGLPPLHCPVYGQRYPEGWQQAAHHPVYTTRGVGMMGPQLRFCCPPEVTLLTLQPA